MNYKLWSVFRIIFNFLAFLILLYIFLYYILGLSYATVFAISGFIGQLLPLLILIRLFLALFRTPRAPKCSTCKREMGESLKIYELKKSKTILDRLFKFHLFDILVTQEYRCYSSTCYPKNERFNGFPMIKQVFLNRNTVHRVIERKKLVFKNIEIISN